MAGSVRCTGSLAVHMDALHDWLGCSGCSAERSVRCERAFARFSWWMAQRHLELPDLDGDLIDEYVGAEQERIGSRTPAAFQYLPIALRDADLRQNRRQAPRMPVRASSVDADTGPCQSGYIVCVPPGSGSAGDADMPRANADEEVGRMQAAVGDRLHVHANIVGHPGRTGEIVEVRGAGGEPPYLVRFDDGHTALVFPGPDAIIEHPRKKGTTGSAKG